jgi:membrane-bound lytic murein transglycosylase F
MHPFVLLLLLLFPVTLFLNQESETSYKQIVLTPMTALETKKLNKDIQKTLPQWRKKFEKFGKKYHVPWTLVAAVAYQESKWDNDARSYTGVRGLMQITSSTAAYIGIDDREDATQSIQGGSYYLRYLYEKSPKYLSSSDRWIQALAGYNIGWAHLRDVHRLARAKHMNAYRWENLKKLLPLKANEKYRKHFNFGLARGNETVDFVESVIGYYQVLNFRFPEQRPFKQRTIASISNTIKSPIQTPIPQSQTSLNF